MIDCNVSPCLLKINNTLNYIKQKKSQDFISWDFFIDLSVIKCF